MSTASPADRAIHAASDALDKLLSQARAFRSALTALRLPIAAAEDRLDHTDDLCMILISQLNRAAEIVSQEIERLQLAEEVEYARTHGLAALSINEALIDRDFTRWTNSLAANDDRAGLESA